MPKKTKTSKACMENLQLALAASWMPTIAGWMGDKQRGLQGGIECYRQIFEELGKEGVV